MIRESVEIAVQYTWDTGKCGACGEILENDCKVYGMLGGMIDRPDYYSIEDAYEPDMMANFDADDDQRMVSFSSLDARTFCAACHDKIIYVIESGHLDMR